MTDIELEEGEAYFAEGGGDDENIDPDKDFSYIDKKIENVLGHYQKDFMGGLSAEILGARFGGYGSFLPMHQRSPPVLSNQRMQSHISSESPRDPSEKHTAVANHSLPVRSRLTSSDHDIQALPESGICSMNNQSKLQSLHDGDGSSSDEQKKPIAHHTVQKSLKLRVKMTSESVFSHDTSALYSGLGLDLSPSSPEDRPSQCDGTSPDMQQVKPESPTYIVKIMTSFPPPDKEMLSPLNSSLICLVGTENNLQTALLGCAEVVAAAGKNKTNKDCKSKVKDANKDKKSKQKESSKEKKSKNKLHVKNVTLVNENHEYPADSVAVPANKTEDSVASLAKEVVLSKASTNAIDACSEGTRLAGMRIKNAGPRDPALHNKKGEVGPFEDETEKSMQRVQTAKYKDEGKSIVTSFCDASLMDGRNMKALRGKTQKEKNFSCVMSKESHAEKGNEVKLREEETTKLFKQQMLKKDRVKDVVLNSRFPKEDGVLEKENGVRKRIQDQPAGSFSVKTAEEKDKHHHLSGKMVDLNVETLEPSMRKPHSNLMSHLQSGVGAPSGNEHSSSLAKRKSRESQTKGTSFAELRARNLMVGSLAAANEETIVGSNIPCKTKRDGGLQREMKRDGGVAANVNPAKKGKDVSMKDSVMGVSDRETIAFASKLKEKSSSKKIGLDANIVFNMEGHPSGSNLLTEKLLVGDVLPTEMEDWVLCEKCEKWRLLPLGMNPDSLPKEWTCSMITWLPGKNSCGVSEDETTNGLRALYQGQVAGPHLQNTQVAYLHGTGFVHPPASVQHDDISGGGRKKNLFKTQMNTRQTGSQEHIASRKDQQHTGEMKSAKHQKRLFGELGSVGTPGGTLPSKPEKKRATEFKASEASKKMKRAHQQPKENVVFGLSADESRNYNHSALGISNDLAKRNSESSLVNTKDSTHYEMNARNPEVKDARHKKRKLKGQQEIVLPTEEFFGEGQHHQMNKRFTGKSSGTDHRKEKKLKVSNVQGRENSTEKRNGGTSSRDDKHNHDGSSVNDLCKGGRGGYVALEQNHTERSSQKTDGRKSSEKALDLGLSDNATTSSSSKISQKVKAKVKCSPAGSISSSPFRVSKSRHGDEAEKLSAKQPKFKAECAIEEYKPHTKLIRDRKSSLSRNSGIVADAVDQDHSGWKSSVGRHPSVHGRDKPKLEGHKDSGKLSRTINERDSLTSQQKLVPHNQDARSVTGLHFHGNDSERGKSHVSLRCHEESHGLPETERYYGSDAARVSNVNVKPQPTGHMSTGIEASSSLKKDVFPWDANTALKEATNLRDSAGRLKIAGSGLESSEALFQAALKFLHGASLLEPGSNEGGKYGEMTPTAAYSTTAKLCEHCAHEYERCNDMASAALAYKCMEVAYMRVIYSNDLAASRDRVELDMAVRAAPQAESPSSSASDIDSLNNQAVGEIVKDGNVVLDQRSHVISARNRPNFLRLLNFTQHVNLAMEASRRSQTAFEAANPVLTQAGKVEAIAFIKSVLDFSFHDIGGLLHLMKLAMDALNAKA